MIRPTFFHLLEHIFILYWRGLFVACLESLERRIIQFAHIPHCLAYMVRRTLASTLAFCFTRLGNTMLSSYDRRTINTSSISPRASAVFPSVINTSIYEGAILVLDSSSRMHMLLRRKMCKQHNDAQSQRCQPTGATVAISCVADCASRYAWL